MGSVFSMREFFGLVRLDTAVQMYILFTRSNPPNSWRSYPEGYLPPPNAP